jgi:hypothetical protein
MPASVWVWTRVTGGEHPFALAVMADPPYPPASSPEAATARPTSTCAGRTSQPEPAATTANSGSA